MNVLDSQSNFLGLEKRITYGEANCVIQQLPYEYSSSYGKGSYNGPGQILSASHFVEFFDIELDTETYKQCNIIALESNGHSTNDPANLMNLIAEDSKKILNDDKFLVSLGAEHSLTYGIFKAVKNKFPEVGILQLDAHSDLRDSYEGSIWSHASVMARIHELEADIFQVGIRAQSQEERQFYLNSKRIHCWYDKDIHDNDQWMDDLVEQLPSQLYITIDADGFNAEVAPSVGTPEPGGLGWYQSLKLLRKVFNRCEVIGFDIVELTPKGKLDRTAYNLAQLCYKLIGYKFVR